MGFPTKAAFYYLPTMLYFYDTTEYPDIVSHYTVFHVSCTLHQIKNNSLHQIYYLFARCCVRICNTYQCICI